MKCFAAALAFTALAIPGAGQARSAMTPEATQAAVRYALPHLIAGFRSTCGPKLPRDGYLARNGAAMIDRYSQGSAAAWPSAREALMALGANKKPEIAQMFAQMPDSALRPFVDATISSMVATKVKTADCGEIERGLELLAPLPPENIAGLAGFLFEMSQRGKKPMVGRGG